MPDRPIAESDLWLVLEILNAQPTDEAYLRIREAIAYGRRTMLPSGEPARWIALGAADALLLRADLRVARHRFGPAEQQAIDRIVGQLR
jgi:hypothetical protein